jgi:hypothetical protein
MKTIGIPAFVLAVAFTWGCSEPDDDSGGGDTFRDDAGTDGGGDTGGGDAADGTDGSDYVPVDGHTDGECYQDLDIMFVIDVSTSMTPVLAALRDGIGEVWTYATGISANTQFGLVVFVDDALFTNEGMSYSDVATLQNEFDDWREFCGSEAEPGGSAGTNTDCPENTVDAVWIAAHGFPWRENSIRIVILATDDTFKQSPQTLGSAGLPVHHTYADLLAALREREIRVAAFADHDGSNCAIGGTGRDTEPGFFSDFAGSAALPVGTGGEVFEIDGVEDDPSSMTQAINDVILDEYCTPYIY